MNLRLNNIDKHYDKKVLHNIDLELRGYKSIALVGPSGCGKSTLLRLIAGIEFPEEGSVIINDIEINESTVKEHQKTIGYVFQKHNLFPHLSLLRNITLILEKTRGYTKDDAYNRGVDLLTMLHLADQKDKLPKNVSGGQSQRASIARALSTEPDLLLLDEPTAALDPILTYEVLDAVNELKDMGKDFIFVTHEISFVKSFADYFIFINEGEIIEHGEIRYIDEPKTEKLQEFMSKVIHN